MAARFDVIAGCDLFTYVRQTMPAGDTVTVEAHGDDLGDGFVAKAQVPLLESGEFLIEYEGHAPYSNIGFTTGSQWGHNRSPAGNCQITAVTDVAYGCFTPKPGLKLDHVVLEVGQEFDTQHTPTYFVPIVGTAVINGTPIENKQIARRDVAGPIQIETTGAVVAVWQR